VPAQWPANVAYDPELVPPVALMLEDGIHTLEEWFRWGEEWSMLLRVYGGITSQSAVLEIGCGVGRTAFPLRYVVRDGSYDGFDVVRHKIRFAQQAFTRKYPRFGFTWADIHNTFYNPEGRARATEYRFPYADNAFDLVYAASVFTHMLPEAAKRYFSEADRVLRPGGRCVFSFFLLDHYRPGQPRPLDFGKPDFAFDHGHGGHGADFAVAVPDNPEYMTAYRLSLIERLAEQAGLTLTQPPVPGLWSGTTPTWVGTQDLIVLRKRERREVRRS
jgi:SAM-dependent methyltransferase